MNDLNELLKHLQKKDKTQEILKLWRKGRIGVFTLSNYSETPMSSPITNSSISWTNTELPMTARRI